MVQTNDPLPGGQGMSDLKTDLEALAGGLSALEESCRTSMADPNLPDQGLVHLDGKGIAYREALKRLRNLLAQHEAGQGEGRTWTLWRYAPGQAHGQWNVWPAFDSDDPTLTRNDSYEYVQVVEVPASSEQGESERVRERCPTCGSMIRFRFKNQPEATCPDSFHEPPDPAPEEPLEERCPTCNIEAGKGQPDIEETSIDGTNMIPCPNEFHSKTQEEA